MHGWLGTSSLPEIKEKKIPLRLGTGGTGARAVAESPTMFTVAAVMKADVQTVDFSGWPMVVHKDMPPDVAYAICEAIAAKRSVLPTDNFKPLRVAQLCADDAEAPRGIPLHPGAGRFYRERGYLK